MASAADELLLSKVSYDPFLLGDEDEEEGEDTGLIYLIPSRHPSCSNRCKIIREGVGVHYGGGMGDGKVVYTFTMVNENNVTVQVVTYGATISSISVPDKKGNFDDIVLGFDNVEGYRSSKNPYFGATIGRITGVIPQYVFSIDGEKYYVSNNYLNGHHANGGFIGFDKVLWNHYVAFDKLILSYMSKDMEEGFPGDVLVNRSFELTGKDELIIETTATCTKPTPLDITTHVDWNLASHSAGPQELYNHYLMINSDKYAQVDSQSFLTGKLKTVSRTVLDHRIPRPIGKIIHKIPGGGYDHYFSLTRGNYKKGVVFAAKLTHPGSGRYVEVLTDQPGLQVYTQNNLFAFRNVVEGHPISCWCHDPTEILRQQSLQPDNTEKTSEEQGEGEEGADDEGESELEGEGEGEEGDEPPGDKHVYKPLQGKHGSEYVRHAGIRLVPLNYPEPIARHREHMPYLLNPGEKYINTTIYKFGAMKEKPKNLSEIDVNLTQTAEVNERKPSEVNETNTPQV